MCICFETHIYVIGLYVIEIRFSQHVSMYCRPDLHLHAWSIGLWSRCAWLKTSWMRQNSSIAHTEKCRLWSTNFIGSIYSLLRTWEVFYVHGLGFCLWNFRINVGLLINSLWPSAVQQNLLSCWGLERALILFTEFMDWQSNGRKWGMELSDLESHFPYILFDAWDFAPTDN